MNNEYFRKVPVAQPPKSTFDLSHERKMSMHMGTLVPFLVQEVIPQDNYSVDSSVMVRFSPLVSPVMARINCHIDYFFVPYRLLDMYWQGNFQFEKFITEEEELSVPSVDLHDLDIAIGSLGDFFGLPAVDFKTSGSYSGWVNNISLFPFYAYVKIYNDFYRDPLIQSEVDIDYTVLSEVAGLIEGKPITRNYENDYFTTCKPYAQVGNPAEVELNIGFQDPARIYKTGTTTNAQDGAIAMVSGIPYDGGVNALWMQTIADDTAISIHDIRYAEALQQYLERLNKTGYRYKNWLRGFFGMNTSDMRLDMPEYLGGSKQAVVVSEAMSQTQTLDSLDNVDTPLGTLGGHAISVGRDFKTKYNIEEHGIIIGIMSILPETQYYQGLPKMFTRLTNLDWPLPQFAELGDQGILGKEVYYSDDGSYNESIWGYQPRYNDWRYGVSTVHGEFRDTLEHWHMGRKFSSKPYLNGTFLKAEPTHFTRIFAIESLPEVEQLYVQVYNQVRVNRALPYYVDARIG